MDCIAAIFACTALLGALPAGAAPRTRLALLDVRGAGAAAHAGLNPLLASEAGHRDGVELLSRPELAAVAGAEVEPTFLACAAGACLSETGLALDLQLVAIPSLAAAGDGWVFSIALFDVQAARPRALVTRSVTDERELLEAARATLREAFDAAERPRPAGPRPRTLAVLATRAVDGAGGGLEAVVAGELAGRDGLEVWPALLSDAQLPTDARAAPACSRHDATCLVARGEARGVELIVASDVTAGAGSFTFGLSLLDRATGAIVARSAQTVPTAAELPAAARLATKEAFFDERAARAAPIAAIVASGPSEPYGPGFGWALTWTGAGLAALGSGLVMHAYSTEPVASSAELALPRFEVGAGEGLFVGGLFVAGAGVAWLLTYDDEVAR